MPTFKSYTRYLRDWRARQLMHRSRAFVGLLALGGLTSGLALLLAAGLPAAAEPIGQAITPTQGPQFQGDGPADPDGFREAEPGAAFPGPVNPAGGDRPPGGLPASDGMVSMVIVLDAPPAAQIYQLARRTLHLPEGAARRLAALHAARLDAAQRVLIGVITQPPITAIVESRVQQTQNAIFVRAAPDQLDALRTLPGVREVRLLADGQLQDSGGGGKPGQSPRLD